MADGEGLIDHKKANDPVLKQTMLQFWVRKLCIIWKLFFGISRKVSKIPAISKIRHFNKNS